METYKIYRNNQVVTVSLNEYKDWLMENASLYYIGPHITEDNREIYTAFTANTLDSSCFTTFEVFLDENDKGYKENVYDSTNWLAARDVHRNLLKVKKAKRVLVAHH